NWRSLQSRQSTSSNGALGPSGCSGLRKSETYCSPKPRIGSTELAQTRHVVRVFTTLLPHLAPLHKGLHFLMASAASRLRLISYLAQPSSPPSYGTTLRVPTSGRA